MPKPQKARFNCAACGAEYHVVREEAPLTANEPEIVCINCDAPLDGRDGKFVLKYFLVEPTPRPSHRRR